MMILKKFKGLIDGQVQKVVYVFALIADFQHGFFKAFALAIGAGDIDIGKKLHFNLFKPVSFAGFTAPVGNIE